MTPTKTLPLPAISPEVRAFAIDRGVEAYLANLVAAVRRIFPASRIDVVVQDDPELSNNRQIVFEVDDHGRSVDEIMATKYQWFDELIRCCPSTHTHVFCLIQGRLTGSSAVQAAAGMIQLLDAVAEPTRNLVLNTMKDYERLVLRDVTWQP